MHDEPPYRFLRQVGIVASQAMERRMDRHLAEDHRPPLPGPRSGTPFALPFQNETIPDAHLARMVEMIETTEPDIPSVAITFGYPPSLAERELARYKSLNRRYLLSLATA